MLSMKKKRIKIGFIIGLLVIKLSLSSRIEFFLFYINNILFHNYLINTLFRSAITSSMLMEHRSRKERAPKSWCSLVWPPHAESASSWSVPTPPKPSISSKPASSPPPQELHPQRRAKKNAGPKRPPINAKRPCPKAATATSDTH